MKKLVKLENYETYLLLEIKTGGYNINIFGNFTLANYEKLHIWHFRLPNFIIASSRIAKTKDGLCKVKIKLLK